MYILPFCAEQAFSPPHQRLASLLIALCVHVSGLIDVYVRLFVCAMFGDCVWGSLCQHMEVSAQICGRALSQMCLFLYFVCILVHCMWCLYPYFFVVVWHMNIQPGM